VLLLTLTEIVSASYHRWCIAIASTGTGCCSVIIRLRDVGRGGEVMVLQQHASVRLIQPTHHSLREYSTLRLNRDMHRNEGLIKVLRQPSVQSILRDGPIFPFRLCEEQSYT
jgi:hypothetical protein